MAAAFKPRILELTREEANELLKAVNHLPHNSDAETVTGVSNAVISAFAPQIESALKQEGATVKLEIKTFDDFRAVHQGCHYLSSGSPQPGINEHILKSVYDKADVHKDVYDATL